MTVTLMQTELVWEDRDANLAHFNQLMAGILESADLIILPEMFSTGFSMNTEALAEKENGATIQWLQQKAGEMQSVLTGSVIIEEGGRYYNRLFWMRPDGTYDTYDKRHLFSMANEQDHFTAGHNRLVVELNGWRICPQICYDLRFPVWTRNRDDYDFMFFVANWPERRNFAWKSLLQARAIENQAYVVGLNRIGTDGNGVYHSGDSALIDPLGEVVFTEPDNPAIRTFTLSAERLNYVRTKFPFLQDRDDFELK